MSCKVYLPNYDTTFTNLIKIKVLKRFENVIKVQFNSVISIDHKRFVVTFIFNREIVNNSL